MKKLISILIIIVFTFSLVGCKESKQEIDKLAVVLATGLDLTEDNKYLITVQILNAQKSAGGSMGNPRSGEGQNPADVIFYSAEGDTIDDSIAKMSVKLGNSLFFHSKYTVIGKKLAQYGMELTIDALTRGFDTRLGNVLLVTGGNASDIVKNVTSEDKIPANTVEKLINIQGKYGYCPIINRVKFVNSLYNGTSAPITGVINLKRNDGNIVFDLSGTAVFDKNKLVGFMDMYETRGMQWTKSGVKSGEIVTYFPDNKIIDFTILDSKGKSKFVLKNGKPVIKIDITVKSNLYQTTEKIDPVKNYKVMDELNDLQSAAVIREVQLSAYAAQKQFKLDILNFSGAIKRDNPDYWSKIEKNWKEVFPNIKVEINVNSQVKRPGLISKPII